MSRPYLELGYTGKYVEELQKLLNKILKEEHRGVSAEGGGYTDDIKVNGQFNDHTYSFVLDFQTKAYLLPDGKVGKMTWSALLGTEAYNCFDKPDPVVNAPDETGCWAGALGMLLKRTGPVTTKPIIVEFEQIANKIGGIKNTHENMKKWAHFHYVEMLEGELNCVQLCNLVNNFGRIMLNMRGINSQLQSGIQDDSHLLILMGVRGDGTANGTTMTLCNPSSSSERYITDSYAYLRNRFREMTYQCFYVLSNNSAPWEY